MSNLIGVYYMALHLAGVKGTAKANCTVWMATIQSGYNEKVKTASG